MFEPKRIRKAQRAAYGLLVALALLWLAAIMLPAYWAADGELFSALILRRCFSLVCHQMPERSFYLFGHPLAVCARCTGIYFGVAVGMICYPFFRALDQTDLPPRSFLFLACAPAAIDFLSGFFHIVENTHLSRFLTGAIAGAGLAFYIVPAILCLTRELAEDGRILIWKNRA